MKEITLDLNFVSDAGHGWLLVDMTAMHLCNLLPSDFTEFSYAAVKKGKFQFALEEDDDAPKFIKTAEEHGLKINIKETEVVGESAIRSWVPITTWKPGPIGVNGSIGA
tara:strand:+ start:3874 stop:4200 length:327 start_codon:yes stop_codon:yes gene_type:complete